MQIGLDISPLSGMHGVRGTGFYTKHLKQALQTYFPENSYYFFNKLSDISEELDIIHYPYFEPFFLTVPLIKKTKTVITIHDLTPLKFPRAFPPGLQGKVKLLFQKFLLRNIDSIITDSISSKKDIIHFLKIPEEKISVIYLAAGEEFKKLPSSNKQNTVFRTRYHLPEKFALYVGDVTWNKNLPRIIQAATEAKIPLVLTGKTLVEENYDTANPWNKDRNTVMQLIQDNPYIMRTGFVSNEDLVMFYNLATVCLFPSLYEGFGLPVLEAMKCGCPVITSNQGSLPEVAGKAAYGVNAYDVESIKHGLSEVFTHPHLQADLSKQGEIQAAQFSWERVARQTYKVYQNIVDK